MQGVLSACRGLSRPLHTKLTQYVYYNILFGLKLFLTLSCTHTHHTLHRGTALLLLFFFTFCQIFCVELQILLYSEAAKSPYFKNERKKHSQLCTHIVQALLPVSSHRIEKKREQKKEKNRARAKQPRGQYLTPPFLQNTAFPETDSHRGQQPCERRG